MRNTLSANPAVSQFALMPGPNGEGCVAGVALSNMLDIKADAYVVPHSVLASRKSDTAKALIGSRAASGMLRFQEYVQNERRGELPWGDVKITESGISGSRLIHVVGMGSGMADRAKDTAEYVVVGSMQTSASAGFETLVIPALCEDVTWSISAENAAEIMLASIYSFWRHTKGGMPHAVLIAVERDWDAYLEFARVLKRLAEPAPAKHAASVRLTKSETFVPTQSSIGAALDDLSELAIMAFYFALRRSNGNMRKTCEGEPWFEKVRHLFTEDGRKNLHPIAIEELRRRFEQWG